MPSAVRYPVPRATPYIPKVPIKGGTFNLEIKVPLMKPGINITKQVTPNPIKTAIYPSSGANDFITVAKITEARPIANATDKSIPPEIITNVCPMPISNGAAVNNKTLCKTNGLRRNVDPYTIRAHPSKNIKINIKKIQFQKLLINLRVLLFIIKIKGG